MLEHSPVGAYAQSNKLWGIDFYLIIVTVLFIGILQFLLSGMPYGIVVAFCLPLIISGTIHFQTRGKPENYLRDFLAFYRKPGSYLANYSDE